MKRYVCDKCATPCSFDFEEMTVNLNDGYHWDDISIMKDLDCTKIWKRLYRRLLRDYGST